MSLGAILGIQEPEIEEIDHVLGAILARPEFQPPEPAPLWRVVGAAWSWVGARLGDLLEWLAPGLDPGAGAWSVAGRWGLAVLGVAGVALLIYLARVAVASLRGRRAIRTGNEPEEGRRVRTPGEWEGLARAAADEGRWRDAAAALYQAVIHRLGGEELLRIEPGKTPGDYRREVAGDPRTAPLLDRFVRRWEPVAFGRRRATRRSWHELVELARALGTRA